MSSITNRNEAYRQIVEELPEKRKRIYQAIKELEKCTAYNIAFFLKIPINEVTGRIKELKDRYLIIEDGSRENKFTNKNNTVYRLPNDLEVKHALVEDMARLSNLQDQISEDLKKGLSEVSIDLLSGKAKKIRNQINRIRNLLN